MAKKLKVKKSRVKKDPIKTVNQFKSFLSVAQDNILLLISIIGLHFKGEKRHGQYLFILFCPIWKEILKYTSACYLRSGHTQFLLECIYSFKNNSHILNSIH